jgi:hypothetical protein
MPEELILKEQKKIFSFVHNYIKSLKGKINIANSAICYFHNYGDYTSSSVLKLHFYGYKYFLRFTINIFKNFFSTIQTENFSCIKRKSKKSKKYKNFLISHVSKKDFLANGSYNDKYFGLNSSNYQNTLFFLNSIDGYFPKKLQENLIIFKKKKKSLSLKYFLNNLISFLIRDKLSFRKLFHQFNYLSQFSNKILPHLIRVIEENNFKRIVLFYEAQPYQNDLIHELKKKKIKTKTFGFYHSGLLPVHTSLAFRDGAPDKLLISGKFQKYYCEKYLRWPKNKVSNVESFRYSKSSIIFKKDKIYLPYSFSKPNTILASLEKFFRKSEIMSLPIFSIQNHPATLNSIRHLKLINSIHKLINLHKSKFNKKSKNISIFIGSTTSVTLGLEQKKQIIHICEDPIFDSFNGGIWKDLIVTRLDKFIFKYSLKQNKHILNISKNNKNKIKKYLK